MEAVLVTGVMFPLAVTCFYVAIQTFALLFKLADAVLGWPYL